MVGKSSIGSSAGACANSISPRAMSQAEKWLRPAWKSDALGRDVGEEGDELVDVARLGDRRSLRVAEAEGAEAEAVAEEGAQLVLERLGVLVGEGRTHGRGLLAHRPSSLDWIMTGKSLIRDLAMRRKSKPGLGIGLAAARETKVGDDREDIRLVALEKEAASS